MIVGLGLGGASLIVGRKERQMAKVVQQLVRTQAGDYDVRGRLPSSVHAVAVLSGFLFRVRLRLGRWPER